MGKFFPGERITNIHGKPRKIHWQGLDLTVIPMYHPAAALRNGNMMTSFKEDFKIIPQVLENLEKKEETVAEEKKGPEQLELI